MGRVILIWDGVLCKLRVSVDELITRKNVLSQCSNNIGTHINVVVEVLKVQGSVSFESCLDE